MILQFLLYLIVGCCLFLGLLYLAQRYLTYFPSRTRHVPSPAEAGVPELQVIELHTKDGLTLKSWYRPPAQPDLPTVIHFHGNAGHIGDRAIIVRPYLACGFGVLLLTYRGYSGNSGSPSEEGLYSDARAALEFVKGKPFLYGDSIGAAVAIQMALEYPTGPIILQAPFTSLADVGQFHYPFLPIKFFLKDKFDNLHKAPKMRVPVLIIHGQNDVIIPVQFGKRLYEAFPEPKQMQIIPDAGHNDLYVPERIIKFIVTA